MPEVRISRRTLSGEERKGPRDHTRLPLTSGNRLSSITPVKDDTASAFANPQRSTRAASGRFVLRIDPGLHAALRAAASEAGMSLNDYCASKLAAPLGNLTAFGGAVAAVRRAAARFGEDLVGVVAFGSWARGELAEGSDVDLLVVLEERVAITRSLYREWDAEPLRWTGRAVEPCFVHLPGERERVSGLWAEVALDGVVLFERGLRISSRLAALRRAIAAGRLVRRSAHGQGYWAEA